MSPEQASRSVSPNAARAVSEQAGLINQLLSVANHLVSHHQSLAGECNRELERHEAELLGKNGEIERLLNAEVQLRQEHEQQLLVERQQWCLEKDALQKVLQEQQGTAHTLEQHLSAQIAALRDELAKQHSGQQTAARTHQDTLEALQSANQQLQQQHSKLQQDLQAALAYRHKCIQQKQELQQLRTHSLGPQLKSLQNEGSAGDVSGHQQGDLTAATPQEGVDTIDNPASSSQDLTALVLKLKGDRELVKRAYIEEKKKADRYRNAYTQLRDLKQPSQRRSKQRSTSASATHSTQQLQCLARQQGNAVQLATTGCKPQSDETRTSTAEGSRLQKPLCKPKKGPTEHNRFTAEMDLAAAGLLGPPPPLPIIPKAAANRLQTGLSWPLRPKQNLERQKQPQHRTGPMLSHQTREQDKPGSKVCRDACVGDLVVRVGMPQPQKEVSSSQELSPGTKEALILAGLLSEDQDVIMGDDLEGTSASTQQQQQEAVQEASERAVQPWQARLAGHAEAIQQLDKDSLCRLSDPCHHPSKRSRSCPPDSFGTAPHQPADSTDAVHAANSSDEHSDRDDAMSGQASDALSAGHNCQAVQSGLGLYDQQPAADALTMPQGVGSHLAASRTVSSVLPAVAALAVQQQDSLDMTQPNLTPADQRHRLAALGGTHPGIAPLGAPSPPVGTSLRPAVDLNPYLECDRLEVGAGASNSWPDPMLNPADDHTAPGLRQDQQQQQRRQQQKQAVGRQGSGPLGLGKGKAAKWKQRAGLRDISFGENEQQVLASDVVSTRQDAGALQQCWLQQGAGQAADGPAVLMDTVQHARGGAEFKYQDVVRRKADRAALEGIQCLDCRKFYEAVGTWGHQGETLPACGHVLLPAERLDSGTSGGGVQQSTGASARQGLHQDASRHRYRFAPPATPEGLWDMGFGDSQDSRM